MIQKTIQICLLAMTMITSVYAEVVLDGTLGTRATLAGVKIGELTEFQITDSFGKQVGDNLFHSFETFNIDSNEVANFSGPDSIQNVISRVTGGKTSNINGGFYSTMPNADMYFINPAGVVFGPNAWIDVQGSFHVSTANYLRLGENGRFDATQPANSLLTVAPPSAFGFLSETPSGIFKYGGFLSVPAGETFSLIGGDLTLQDNQYLINDELLLNSYVMASGGEINLVSVASSGEVPVNVESMLDNAFEKFGKITITDDTKGLNNFNRQEFANIDVSGNGRGSIYIIGGEVVLDNGYVWADTFGDENGQGITIKATEKLELTNGSKITAQVYGEQTTGNGGNIDIETKELNIIGGSTIDISSTKEATGNAGNININAEKSVNISGCLFGGNNGCPLISLDVNEPPAPIFSGIQSSTDTTGNGGQIIISTPILTMESNGNIRSDTLNSGNAGNVLIEVDTLKLDGGAKIDSSSKGINIQTGKGGNITIKANKNISINDYGYERSGLYSNTFTTGEGGTINVSSPKLELKNHGTIQTGSLEEGNAGNIFIDVNELTLHGSTITTQSVKSAGGNIDIQSDDLLYLISSEISTETEGKTAMDDAGNITIRNPIFSIFNKSLLDSTGFVGDGGNINIESDYFIEYSSRLDTSSKFGEDGEIFINSSIEDFNEISKLSTTLNRLELKTPFCETIFGQSTFQFKPRSGLLASPYDLQR